MKKIVILGSTGSIGTQTLEVIEEQKDDFTTFGIVGGSNIDLLTEQALKYQPEWVGIYDESKYQELKNRLPESINIVAGERGVFELVSHSGYQILVAAISGIAGLKSTIKGIEAGKVIALANKETLVAGGNLILDLVKKHNTCLLPVDSEHSAIFQCLNENRKLKKIIFA